MKRISHTSAARDKHLHVDTEGCIVYIKVGMTNTRGDHVTSVEIIPDEGWVLAGTPYNRLTQR